MIEKEDEMWWRMTCNICEDETLTEKNFNELIARAKQEDWKMSKKSGEWKHYCRTCQD